MVSPLMPPSKEPGQRLCLMAWVICGGGPPLIQALGDKDKWVRLAAARALGEIGPEAKEAVPALIQALKWKENIRRKAAWALGEITGQDFSENPDRWQEWWEEQQ